MTRREFAMLAMLLGALTAIVPLSIDPTLPSLPAAARDLATDAKGIQISLSAFLLGIALGQLVLGPLSDRFGRKPVLLVHVALFVTATTGCAMAPDLTTLVACRLVQGFAACSAHVVSRAVIRDRLDRGDAARLFSYVMIVHGVAPLLAPIAGAHLAVEAGWRSVFWALAAYSGVVLVLLAVLLRESLAWPDQAALRPGRLLRNYGTVLGSRVFLGYTACTAFCYSGLFVFLSLSSPVLISHYGATPETYGYYFSATMVGYITGNWLASRLVARLGIDRLLRIGAIGLALSGGASAALAWAGVDRELAVAIPFFFYMLALPLVVPPATAGALAPFPAQAGTASAVLGFLQQCIAMIAGALAGAFHDGTQIPMTTAIFIASLGPIIAYLAIVRGAPRPT
jgi:DHA1 family bicyclomycin/chloramphenicol resistance-like MFS transporter